MSCFDINFVIDDNGWFIFMRDAAITTAWRKHNE